MGAAAWCAFLDSGGKIDNRSRWQIFCHKPCHTVVAWPHEIEVDGISKPTVSVYDIFEILRIFYNELKEKADGTRLQDIPFWGGLVGFASYQIGMMLEGVLSRIKISIRPCWLQVCMIMPLSGIALKNVCFLQEFQNSLRMM